MRGRGGKAGLRYEVELSSLPAELQARWRELHPEADRPALPASVETPSNVALPPVIVPTSATREERWHAWIEWREQVIRRAAELPPRSRERGDMIRTIASRSIDWPSGKHKRVSESTLRTWLRAHDRGGDAGLANKTRKDAGEREVFVSRRLDAAMRAAGFDDSVLASIAHELHTGKKGTKWLWEKGAPGASKVALLARPNLIKLVEATGFKASRQELLWLCRVPRHFVEADRKHHLIARRDKDAKAFYDGDEFTATRSRAGMKPSDEYILDVHPVDILCRRADGSTATLRMIAGQDAATNRVRATFILFEKGRAVRQADIAEFVIDTLTDPAWGLPDTIYTDRGSEFAFLKDLRTLSRPLGRIKITRSNSHNARAKPVEGLFSILEQYFFSLIDGWIAGDRENKKTARLGREPACYPGTLEELLGDLRTALELYHMTEQRGHLNGLSPNDAFAAWVRDGWRSSVVGRAVLDEALARVELTTVRGGCVKIDKVQYEHPDLVLFNRRKVECRIPRTGPHRDVIAIVVDGRDTAILAQRVPVPGFRDPAGARFAAERKKAQRQALDAVRVSTKEGSLMDAARDAVALHEPAPAIEGKTIRLDRELHAIAEARRALPAPEAEPVPENRSVAYWSRQGERRRAGTSGE